MTDKRKKRTLTKQEQKQVQAQYDLDNHLDSLFEAYVLTGDIFKLSAFVRDGGDINAQNLRETIAELILTGPPKHPHGSKDEQSITFYIEVETRRLSLKPTKATRKKGLSLQETLASLKKTTKNDAIYEIIEQMVLPGNKKGELLSLEGGITKHKKGKELFVRAFGREWNCAPSSIFSP